MSISVTVMCLLLNVVAPSSPAAVCHSRTEALHGPDLVRQLIVASLALLPRA
jgi:hypothetical protein